MLVSSIGYFKNNTDNFRKADYNQAQVLQQVAIRGLSKDKAINQKLSLTDIIKALFGKEAKLRNRAIDMIG